MSIRYGSRSRDRCWVLTAHLSAAGRDRRARAARCPSVKGVPLTITDRAVAYTVPSAGSRISAPKVTERFPTALITVRTSYGATRKSSGRR